CGRLTRGRRAGCRGRIAGARRLPGRPEVGVEANKTLPERLAVVGCCLGFHKIRAFPATFLVPVGPREAAGRRRRRGRGRGRRVGGARGSAGRPEVGVEAYTTLPGRLVVVGCCRGFQMIRAFPATFLGPVGAREAAGRRRRRGRGRGRRGATMDGLTRRDEREQEATPSPEGAGGGPGHDDGPADPDRFDFDAVFAPGDYLHFYGQTLTPERSAREVALIRTLLNLRPGDEVLDLACGHGRLAVPMAELGMRVTGLDRSEGFL